MGEIRIVEYSVFFQHNKRPHIPRMFNDAG